MTSKEKWVFLAFVPIAAAGIGAGATVLSAPPREQIVVTGEAAKAAKNGQLTIQLVRKDESNSQWPMALGVVGAIAAVAAILIVQLKS